MLRSIIAQSASDFIFHPIGSMSASSLCPVLDGQPRDGFQVAVSRDHRAVAQGERDGGDLDVNLLHGPTDPLQFVEEPAELLGRRLVVGPEDQPREAEMQAMEVAFTGFAPAEPGPELTEHRRADADAVAPSPLGLTRGRIPLRSWLKS